MEDLVVVASHLVGAEYYDMFMSVSTHNCDSLASCAAKCSLYVSFSVPVGAIIFIIMLCSFQFLLLQHDCRWWYVKCWFMRGSLLMCIALDKKSPFSPLMLQKMVTISEQLNNFHCFSVPYIRTRFTGVLFPAWPFLCSNWESQVHQCIM